MYNHYTGDPGYLPKDIERYARVTPADVQRVVRAHLRKDARVVVLAVRGDKKLDPDPPAPPVARNRGHRVDQRRRAWRKQAAARPARARVPALPAPQSFELANGLTVLHLQRSAIFPSSARSWSSTPAWRPDDPALPGVADFTAAMLEEGTTSRTSQQIADAFDRLGAGYAAQTHRDTTSLADRRAGAQLSGCAGAACRHRAASDLSRPTKSSASARRV